MAKMNKVDFLEKLKNYLGEDTSDEALSLIEDASDSFEEQKDTTDWKQKYEDNDKEWRQKYRDRFFNKPVDDDAEEEEEKPEEKTSFSDLFKTD